MVGNEVCLSRFPTGDRRNWTDAEWDVLDKFQRIWLNEFFHHGEECFDDGMCMFGLAQWPLDSLFEQLLAQPAEAIVERFWQDWCSQKSSIWITAFWEDDMMDKALQFYQSEAVRTKIGVVLASGNKDLADKTRQVLEVIDTARQG